jgi:hypothetical protein
MQTAVFSPHPFRSSLCVGGPLAPSDPPLRSPSGSTLSIAVTGWPYRILAERTVLAATTIGSCAFHASLSHPYSPRAYPRLQDSGTACKNPLLPAMRATRSSGVADGVVETDVGAAGLTSDVAGVGMAGGAEVVAGADEAVVVDEQR